MLKLVIFARVVVAKAALEDAPAVLPNTALALDAFCVTAGTRAGMTLQALPAVAHPRLAKSTDKKDCLVARTDYTVPYNFSVVDPDRFYHRVKLSYTLTNPMNIVTCNVY